MRTAIPAGEYLTQLLLSFLFTSRKSFRAFVLILLIAAGSRAQSQMSRDTLRVRPTNDFELSGSGRAAAWAAADWLTLTPNRPDNRKTDVKTLYSAKGIYFLFFNQDTVITATRKNDFDRLWMEDVTEVFLWPDTAHTVYLEYEISPLNKELVILVPNLSGKFRGWRPWEYEGSRKVIHRTHIEKDRGWWAEFFIPYELFNPLGNVPPVAGTVWRANFYRVDYDHRRTVEWSWQQTDKSFHEFDRFGVIVFE